MNTRSVIHVQGWLLLFLAVALLFPIPFSLYYGDSDYLSLLIAALITAAAGGVAVRFTDLKSELRAREGFAIVTFAWVFISLFGCLPFLFSGAIPSFADAYFETMSGFSTTGATILTDIEALSHGLLMWRSLTHWIGGMGIILLSLAILPFLGVGGMQLFRAEVPGPTADKLTPRLAGTAKILWGVYLLLTIIETALLMVAGMSFFEALCHTFGTLATGGYSTRNTSVAAFDNPWIHWIIMAFMFLAGTNFALHYRLLRGDFKAHIRNSEFRVYVAIIGVATLLILTDTIFRYENAFHAIQDTLFQVLSIGSTTGYGTADFETWSATSQFILFGLMFIGGSAGSTSGGIKILRFILLVKFTFNELARLIHPHAVLPVRYDGVAIPREVVSNVLGFFGLFLLLYAGGIVILTALGMDFISALTAAVATLGNIGPGLGSVGPTDNYGHLSAATKWVLSAMMLMGRLELYTVVVLLSPGYWRK